MDTIATAYGGDAAPCTTNSGSIPRRNGYAMVVEFLRVHQASLWLIGTLSLIVFVGTLVAIPMLVIHIPADYFTRRRRSSDGSPKGYSAFRLGSLVVKNIVGAIFLLVGITMLILPGQGVITLLIGIMLLNFPGKFALQRRIIEQQSVLHAVNWMRLKARKPALKLPRKGPQGDT
ncbi:MAG: hypothetical protein JRF35_08880 [Deltaproteobacteria bacterium]|nr:hypothetical protein [Deltaproteobacteria bacterium]